MPHPEESPTDRTEMGDIAEEKVTVSSDAEEDSKDEEMGSEDGSEEESDGEEEDDEEDEEEEDESDEDADDSGIVPGLNPMEVDSSDSELEKCPVCLSSFRDQDVGSPESCDHTFCLECILEWSKNVNTCPVDRQVFHLIMARHSLEGTVYKRIPVEDRRQGEDEEQDITYCEVCGQCDREDRMLLCDHCDLGYHLECLDPPLDRVPVEEWFCPDCSHREGPQRVSTSSQDRDEEVVYRLVEEVVVRRRPSRRQIARTQVSERVIARIMASRASRRIVSDEEFEEDDVDTSSITRRRTTSTTRRKTTRKRRTKKRRSTKSKTTGKRKRKVGRRKRKTKKGKKATPARTARTAIPTVKKRLAGRLGLGTPPAGRSIPTVKGRTERTMETQRSDIGVSSLSIFGSRHELDPYVEGSDDEIETRHSGGGCVISQPSRVRHGCFPTKAALKSYPAGVPSVSSTPLPGPGFDLLSDIMLGQQILRMNSEDITINRDGSLHLRKLPQETKSKCSQPKTSSRTVFTGLISDGRSPYRRAAGSEGNDSPAETSGGEQTNQRTSGDNSSDNSSSQTQDGNNAGAGDSGSPCEGAGDTSGHYGGDDIGGDSGYNMDNTTQAISDSVENESQNSQNAQNSDNRTDRTESSVSSPENKDEDECVENSKEDKSDNEQMVVDSTTGNDHNTAETSSYGGENNTCNNNDVENDAEVVTGSASVPGAADDVGDDSNDVMDTSQSYSPDAVTCSPKAAGNSTEAESCNPEAARGSPDAVGNSTGAVTCIPDHGRLSPSAEGHSQDFKPDSELREQSQESTDHPQEPAQSSDTLDKSKDSEKGIFPTINVPERESDGDAEENDEDPSCTDGQTNDLSQNNDHDNIDCNLNNDSQENANTLDYDKSSLSDVNELSVATDPEAAGNISDCELETQESAAANDNVDTTCNTGDENNAEAGGMSHYNPFEVIVISPKAMEGYGEDDETQGEIWGDEGMESGEIQEQVPISELPRIPKIKRKPSVEDENSQPGDGLRSVLSRIGTESKKDNYPKWEKREKREKEESRSEPERSQSEPDKNSKYTREDRESYSRDDRDGYGRDDREGYGREDRDSFGRDDREEDRDRRRDRHSKRRRRSRSREKDRRRSRSRDRDRKYRRSRERDRSSRDHSPGRDYDRHRRRRDRSRDRYFRRRSRSASPRRDRKYGYDRESSRHSTEDPPERIQKGNDEFKGTVRMFSQSLKEASDSDKDKRQRLKRSPRGDLDEAKPAKQFHMTLKMVPPDEVIELDNTDEEEEEEVNNAQPEQPEEETKPEPPLPSVAPAPPKPEPVPLMEQDIPPPRSAQPGLSEDVYDPSQPTGSESPTPPELNTAEVRPLNMLQEIQFPRSQELLPPVTSGIQGVEGANVILPNLGGMVRMIPAGMRPHPMLMNPMMMGSHLRGLQRFPPGFPHPPMHMLRNRFPEVQNGVPLQPGRLPFPQGSLPPGMTPGLMEVPPPPGPPGPLQGQQLPPRPPPGPPPRLPADLQFNMEQPPPPLPQKADLNNISSLLNVQGKLAHLIRPPISEPPQSENMMVKQDEQLFKVPLPPPPLIQQPQAKMLPNKDTSNGPRVSAGPGSVNSSEVMEVVDMDVASPLEDDDMGISFSPPPEKDEPTTAGKGVSEGNSGKTGEDSSMKQDDIPASAVELDMQSKYIKKLNRQERVVEEVKLAIKPHYNKGRINKEEYKEIMRKAVPRICHSKSGDINPVRIRKYVEACVEKARQQRKWEAKKEGSSASNSGKTSKKISGKV